MPELLNGWTDVSVCFKSINKYSTNILKVSNYNFMIHHYSGLSLDLGLAEVVNVIYFF